MTITITQALDMAGDLRAQARHVELAFGIGCEESSDHEAFARLLNVAATLERILEDLQVETAARRRAIVAKDQPDLFGQEVSL